MFTRERSYRLIVTNPAEESHEGKRNDRNPICFESGPWCSSYLVYVGIQLITITSGDKTMKPQQGQGNRGLSQRRSRRNASISVEPLEGRALLSMGMSPPTGNPSPIFTSMPTMPTTMPTTMPDNADDHADNADDHADNADDHADNADDHANNHADGDHDDHDDDLDPERVIHPLVKQGLDPAADDHASDRDFAISAHGLDVGGDDPDRDVDEPGAVSNPAADGRTEKREGIRRSSQSSPGRSRGQRWSPRSSAARTSARRRFAIPSQTGLNWGN